MCQKILLVEDDPAILETLCMFLEYEGYEVFKTPFVNEANAFLLREKPDLVMLDYMLGELTSEPVARTVREQFGAQVPIVLLTAVDDSRSIGEFLGADAVVTKPFELDLLLGVIRKQVQLRTKIAAAPALNPVLPGGNPSFVPEQQI